MPTEPIGRCENWRLRYLVPRAPHAAASHITRLPRLVIPFLAACGYPPDEPRLTPSRSGARASPVSPGWPPNALV
jgi:hypothetical protein